MLDERVSSSSITKNLTMENKISRQSSVTSNNLLKPDSNVWTDSTSDVEVLRNKSQSLSNIAGKI